MYNNAHCLCFIRDERNDAVYSKIYSEIDSRLSQGHAVIYAAENDTSHTVRQMVKAGVEAEEYIRKNVLIVVDKQSAYLLQTKLDQHNIINPWHTLVSKKGKGERYSGILAVVVNEKQLQPSSYHFQKHIAFEKIIGTKPCEPAVEVVCCYTSESVLGLPLKEIISILSAHQHTVHNSWRYNEWTTHKIIEAISKGIDDALGVEGAKLIFQTLRLVYKINEDLIVSNPDLFEDTMRKLLGKGADSVLNAIANEIKRQIAF